MITNTKYALKRCKLHPLLKQGLPAPTLMPGSVAGGYRPAPLAPSGPGSYAAMLAAAGGGAGASASAAGAGGYVPAGYAAAAADEDGMDVEMEMETEDAEPAPAPAAAAAASSAAAAAQAPARGEERLNVRYDYTPQLPSAASAVQAPTTFIDPRTGHAVPIDQATEHLRVELLDPQWAIQVGGHRTHALSSAGQLSASLLLVLLLLCSAKRACAGVTRRCTRAARTLRTTCATSPASAATCSATTPRQRARPAPAPPPPSRRRARTPVRLIVLNYTR